MTISIQSVNENDSQQNSTGDWHGRESKTKRAMEGKFKRVRGGDQPGSGEEFIGGAGTN